MTDGGRCAQPAARAAELGLLWLLAGRSYLPFGREGNEALRDLNAVPAWLEEHRGELEVVMRLLLPHEAIHRVNSHGPMYNSRYGELSPADEAAYTGAWAMLDRLNVPVVIVHRDWERETPVF